MESLQGQFLIATTQMPDERFQGRVVYVCVHSEEGAMGVVINNPIPGITLADILRSADIDVPAHDLPPVYIGGPVEMETAFFLFSKDYRARNYLDISVSIGLSRDVEILRDISQGKGPKDYIFLLGYAGWAPGQLENELGASGWLALPAEDDILFHTSAELRWQEAAKRFGIDIRIYNDVIGSA